MQYDYILARKSQLHFYKDVPLYTKTSNGFVLYKPEGMTLGGMRLNEARHPHRMYMLKKDKLKGLQEAQKGFNHQLTKNIQSGSKEQIKETLVTMMDETLTEPRSGSLEGVSETIDILMSDYAQESQVVESLWKVSFQDYTTALHSINVMAFALGFAAHTGFNSHDMKIFGLAALLHDVGKTKIDPEILQAAGKLSDEEFEEMKKHTTIGFNILDKCQFNDQRIKLTALDHHEKLDGSGYPNGKSNLSEIAQIIGIIDCYEALTNDDRPYRSAMDPLKALEII
ncbi:MAG: HD domain-containing protein [Desulfobacterales bacterium]|nr:MAG: HD domain-containing protein [Desulfobacterales bacterium]